jgi:hypothetical protein
VLAHVVTSPVNAPHAADVPFIRSTCPDDAPDANFVTAIPAVVDTSASAILPFAISAVPTLSAATANAYALATNF